MVTYNSTLLRHEADHFDELSKRFSDLRIEIDSRASYYSSNEILPYINKLIISDDGRFITGAEGLHHADPVLIVDQCSICNDVYKTDQFVINCSIPPIQICLLDKYEENLCISSFPYEEIMSELKMPLSLINDADLYVIKLIKESSIKYVRVNSRIRNLMSFI